MISADLIANTHDILRLEVTKFLRICLKIFVNLTPGP
jgi:hypothetical protein